MDPVTLNSCLLPSLCLHLLTCEVGMFKVTTWTLNVSCVERAGLWLQSY